MEATEEDLMHTVFPHPTLSEMMHEAVLDAYKRAIHFDRRGCPAMRGPGLGPCMS